MKDILDILLDRPNALLCQKAAAEIIKLRKELAVREKDVVHSAQRARRAIAACAKQNKRYAELLRSQRKSRRLPQQPARARS